MLYRFDLAEAHTDFEADVDADADIDFTGTLAAAAPQDVLGQRRQPVELGDTVVAIGDCLVHALSSGSIACALSVRTGPYLQIADVPR